MTKKRMRTIAAAAGGALAVVLAAGGVWIATRDRSPQVTLQVQQVGATGLDYTLHNAGGSDVYYGQDYALSRQEAGEWRELPLRSGKLMLVNSILYTAPSGKADEPAKTIRWEDDYGRLSPGVYRLSKWVSADEQSRHTYPVSVEFTIPEV